MDKPLQTSHTIRKKGEHMVYIGAVGLGIPQHQITQEEVKKLVANKLFTSNRKMEKLLPVFDNALVKTRQIVVDQDWFMEAHDFQETNETYVTYAKELALEAIDQCMEEMGRDFPFEAIDMIVFVSSTGIVTPSLDAHLLNERPFREDVIRMPLFGLGCAGGAIGLSRGFEWIKLHQDKIALIICCELCSLTFQKSDLSTSNLVGTAIFGDGVGATLLVGKESAYRNYLPGNRLMIRETNSFTKKQSTNVMGWNITNNGFEVIFSKRIPKLIPSLWKQHIDAFLEKSGVQLADIKKVIAHPGGRKVLEEMEIALQLKQDHLSHSYHVLETHGNMSSATVLYVLKQWLREGQTKRMNKDLSILSALGPGFSSELLLLEWVGA
jgi:alkylresorcinol/alkylpyrone synthase